MLSLLLVCLVILVQPSQGLAESVAPTPGENQTQENRFDRLLSDGAATSSDPGRLVEVAALYLEVATEQYTDRHERIDAYERGAAAAKRALALDEMNARAHFLYAANLGRAAQLKGIVASAFSVLDIKAHTARALELQPDYAPALHMMGRLLDELPWFFGGDADAALEHLERAVEVKPAYAHARLDLAKVYLERGRADDAIRHLEMLVGSSGGSMNHSSPDSFRAESKRLLRGLRERVEADAHTDG